MRVIVNITLFFSLRKNKNKLKNIWWFEFFFIPLYPDKFNN